MKVSSHVLLLGMVCLALSLLNWTDAEAQMTWEIGLKAGVSTMKLTGDDVTDYGYQIDADNFEKGDISDLKLGFVGGGYATMHLNKQFGVRLEALYFQKGGKGTVEGEEAGVPYTADLSMTLDYVDIPLLAVFSFPAGPSGTFDIFAGPAVAFNVSAKSKYEWTSEGESGTEEEDIEDVASTEFSGVVGVGFTYALSSVNLFADARWEYGFTKILDTDPEFDAKNMGFGFMLGVGFPLGGTTAAQ